MNRNSQAATAGRGKPCENLTRGYGVLEGYLARQRTSIANGLIPEELRAGKILDIGCGSYPFFLSRTKFREYYGLDRIVNAESIATCRELGIQLVNFDIETETNLPFEDNSIDVVTMLAVLEHLDQDRGAEIIRQIRRILKPGGLYILTTPPPWSDWILRILALARLVSREEVAEHKTAYTPKQLRQLLYDAGFTTNTIQCGYFEVGLNQWVKARKP